MQGTGNINFSLNKNDLFKSLSINIFIFIIFYFIISSISFIYLYFIKYSQYYFSNRNERYNTDSNVEKFFKNITCNSPYDIMNISYKTINGNKFVGLTQMSYTLILIAYFITFFIILQGLIRNFIYSIYSSIIQINPNNNPYNNSNTISKINENPIYNIFGNYCSIASLSIVFLIPFIIPFVIKLLNFDIYNIKHNHWFQYILLCIIFSPLLIVLFFYGIFQSKLQIFDNLYKFINLKDYSYVDYIKSLFNFNSYTILPFILVIYIYCFNQFIYSDLNFHGSLIQKIILYIILGLTVFVIIPIIITFFALNLTFENKNYNSTTDIIYNIRKYGLSNLYDILVKYNYPCFPI